MRLVGITGGVGMGKSTSSAYLTRLGHPVIDTDVLARELVEPGRPALAAIREAFGERVIAPAGKLDRRALASLVFSDAEARRRLESILHPPIRNAWREQAARYQEGGASACFVVIPLLFETGAEEAFSAIACVACSARTQERRLLDRGWSAAEVRARVKSQLPAAEKMERSDYVVWTEGILDLHHLQWREILASLAIPAEAGGMQK